jgi:hypothetical protein
MSTRPGSEITSINVQTRHPDSLRDDLANGKSRSRNALSLPALALISAMT